MSNIYISLEELIEALDYDILDKLHESKDWVNKSYEIKEMLHNGQIEDMVKTILIECTKYHGEQFCATKHKDEFIKKLKRANHTIESIEEVGLDLH